MLVHICCSVDSHFFLERLRLEFPNERLIGFFYDPNIHPYSEYKLRLLDVRRSCNILSVELIEGEYSVESWLQSARGLEREPEKGQRCRVCFDDRLQKSAQKAQELGEKLYTTTLMVSPKKSQQQLIDSSKGFDKEYSVEFLPLDYRSGGGTQTQAKVAKQMQLYRQDYCGCLYALEKQREHQERFLDEMSVPVNNQVQPASVDDRLLLYENRLELEERKIEYKIVKQKFLNYRLLLALLMAEKEIIPSYFLFYSHSKRKKIRGYVEYSIDEVYYLNRENVRLISLASFNELAKSSYGSIEQLLRSPLSVDDEIKLRSKISLNSYDISPIIIVKEVPVCSIEISIDSKIYDDIRELLVTL